MTTAQKTEIETALSQLRDYRREIRREAINTPCQKSHDDRMVEVARVTRQINRMLARIGE